MDSSERAPSRRRLTRRSVSCARSFLYAIRLPSYHDATVRDKRNTTLFLLLPTFSRLLQQTFVEFLSVATYSARTDCLAKFSCVPSVVILSVRRSTIVYAHQLNSRPSTSSPYSPGYPASKQLGSARRSYLIGTGLQQAMAVGVWCFDSEHTGANLPLCARQVHRCPAGVLLVLRARLSEWCDGGNEAGTLAEVRLMRTGACGPAGAS